MSCILHIETSTEACSVAVSEDGWNEFKVADLKGPQHAVQLGVFVDEALSFVDSHGMVLDAVAVSCGPGSYTGLRIGTSFVKGLCFGANVPVITLPTLQILTQEALLQGINIPADAYLCPMIDARRMEVYTAVYGTQAQEITPAWPEIVTETSYTTYLNCPTYFFGNGAAKCQNTLTHPNAHFIPNIQPSATAMMLLAEKAYNNQAFADTAYFEPFYLKEFMATVPKNKLF
jgi:tRNA threonylcarbamoyladenosine biosynthesis protein TsaB